MSKIVKDKPARVLVNHEYMHVTTRHTIKAGEYVHVLRLMPEGMAAEVLYSREGFSPHYVLIRLTKLSQTEAAPALPLSEHVPAPATPQRPAEQPKTATSAEEPKPAELNLLEMLGYSTE